MKVAIVHPWFLELGGAEKVVDILAEMYPSADIFTLSVDQTILPTHLRGRNIYTSSLNRILTSRLRFKLTYFMPLFPQILEGFDVSEYDLVLSSCPPLMGVNVGQNAIHICYCHTPQRTWWNLYAKRQAKMPWILRQIFIFAALHMRIWEFSAMQRIDHVVSNSEYIAQRVFKYFRRESIVIYPPVDTATGYLTDRHDNYYLSVSRLDPEKRLDLLICACNRLNRRLVLIGTGKQEKELKVLAGPTIEFLGYVPDVGIPALYANCRALLFAADEDFGMVAVEAQSFGRPVIAYGHGGSLETVRVGNTNGLPDTGVFFAQQSVESAIDGIQSFEARENSFIPAEIQQHARQFDKSVFVNKMRQFIDAAMRNQ
jgi:glycosyltransferase involved in cell wall biosynthesis